ncbi:M48 family metallopeptidase [Sphingomonas oligophenolica]|uniref:Peptidase M48 family protein n=1 Tax=Sphingomonas oligophenolica TaxID=301154 RepID=A0A502CHR7_9SPHN|nr:M48 family metallopeptidase [Sphingomonas oligophenolica]TPG12727.1 peptidase M48 family protein [Sphingomonas oligophenolica]
MKFRHLGPILGVLALATPSAAVAADREPATNAATFEALRSVDLRMATIAYRLTTANAALCRRLAPTPGWVIHSLGQYDPKLRDVARQVFGFATPIAVEAVVPGAPAAMAGVAANDSLASVGGAAFAATDPGNADATSATRDAALAQIAQTPVTAPLTVTAVRGEVRRTVAIPASPGCKSNFEVLLGPELDASADGSIVQVGVKFFEKYGDDDLAVVIAHELSHNILNHRARLDAAKVSRGLLAELGRNGRLFRQTEDDADLLGMYLLRNAGYDPQIAVRFWEGHGGDIDGGLFRSRTHRSASARAQRIADEIARIPADAPTPYIPPILATRDQPLQ